MVKIEIHRSSAARRALSLGKEEEEEKPRVLSFSVIVRNTEWRITILEKGKERTLVEGLVVRNEAQTASEVPRTQGSLVADAQTTNDGPLL